MADKLNLEMEDFEQDFKFIADGEFEEDSTFEITIKGCGGKAGARWAAIMIFDKLSELPTGWESN